MGVESTTEGWIMVCISSLSCVFGASIVVFLSGDNDNTTKRIITNKKFLSASMALGSGVLIFNSLYTLLPASRQKLNNNLYTFTFFFIGVLFTVLLSWFIEWCAPLAIHTCDPISAVVTEEEQQKLASVVAAKDDSGSSIMIPYDEEVQQPILSSKLQPKKHHDHHHHGQKQYDYGTILISSDQINHDSNSNKQDYFLIGIQTAIAICIHKFPEGLIMFISNQSSSQLGLSVAAAMTIHNLVEGFLITLPLYYATANRFSAFAYASLLGGMSQPLGAVLGLMFIRNVNSTQEQILFGIIFALVSGMMCYIAVQSMLPQAIQAHESSNKTVPLFFFIGIFLIGLTSLLNSV